MEELQLIIEMIAKLPQTALWVLVGFWAYKVIVIGSVYGLIRFAIDKLHSWLTQRKRMDYDVRLMLDGLCISGEKDALAYQLQRLAGRGLIGSSEYIHRESVDWLREAIDDKIAKDVATKALTKARHTPT